MVGRFPGIMASDLANLLHVDPGTLSAALARLESAGIVRRRADPADRRRVRIRLTGKGSGLDRESAGTVEAAVATVLAETSAASLRSTRRLLQGLAGALENHDFPMTGASGQPGRAR